LSLRVSVLSAILCCSFGNLVSAAELKVLFLGDDGSHRPPARFAQLQPVLAKRGIELVYTDSMDDLNPEKLAQYDALAVYGNITRITPGQEQAVLDYVTGGGGYVPIHSASFCFLNSPNMIALTGAQFRSHGTGVVRTQIAPSDHAVMADFGGFESWDETYVHHKHNEQDRTVLEYRVDERGREPWTWVRTHGAGRVFYTAWGHDQRTWGDPGFHNLIERGIRWAAKDDPSKAGPYTAAKAFPIPAMTPLRADVAAFQYVDVGAKIPNYLEGEKWGVQGAPKTTMQLPLSPAESMQHFVTPVGFHVELYVAEPELGGKPIAMNWDERGRLFVCESYDYPNELQTTGQGRDRIRICEDTDQDGRADKFTVFAENLSIPTALTPYRGGMIVQNGGETLYLKDTDGDDRADVREVLISNWNVRDTHGGVSNFRYGLDNWIWAMQGYNSSEPIINGRQQQAFRMGFFRFRLDRNDPPQVTDLEFIRSTDNNTWGLGLSEEGLVFGSTANRNPSVFMPIANRYYERVLGWTKSLKLGSIADTHLFHPITDKVRQVDHFGGYTAAAGHALYTARQYPREYWNRTAFVAGPTGHLVGTFVLSPRNGTDFSSTNAFNLLASDDEWSAPILAEVGPDGNVWVIDWYNYIVQHNPTPKGFETGRGGAYESDLRDKKHGRVYRVVYGNDAPSKTTGQNDNPAALSLIDSLAHPTMLQRLHAQRLLVERGDPSLLPALMQRVADQSVDEIGLNPGAIHALWTMHGLGVLDGSNGPASAAVETALQHPSAGVRRAAVTVLPPTAASLAAIQRAGLLSDPAAQVRLATLLAVADLPATTNVGPWLVEGMSKPQNADDPWIPDAAISAAAQHSVSFLVAVSETESPSPRLLEMATVVAEHYARSDQFAGLPELSRKLITAPSGVASAIIQGFERGWPDQRPLPDTAFVDDMLLELLPKLSIADRGLLLRVARRWGGDSVDEQIANVRQTLREQLAAPDTADRARMEIADQLVALDPRSDDAVAAIIDQITPQTAPETAVALLNSLRASESSELGTRLLNGFERLTPATRAAAIEVLLSRPAATSLLLKSITGGQLAVTELSAVQRQLLSEHPNLLIRITARRVLSNSGALPNPDRQRVIEELAPVVLATGDAVAGKAAFVKHCANCHAHGGEGGKIGPDLTGMAAHPKEELLTHILDPSRSVEGNFRTYSVLTLDGRVRSGLVATESQTTIELIDSEGKAETLLRDDIDQLVRGTKSLMPDGIEKQATPTELRDLLEFLTQRGQYLPLNLAKVATLSSGRGMFYNEQNQGETLLLEDWSPRTIQGVPFQLIDPAAGEVANVIMLYGPHGEVSKRMPTSVSLPCHGRFKKIHLLGGVSGWGAKHNGARATSMIVRLHYADQSHEDHPLRDGEHLADYIRRFDVPGSKFAFAFQGGQQMRYLAIEPEKSESLSQIEFLKGDDQTAPIVMAVTLE
jgi:putative membrane-bound dehydrogenase-like protein